MSGAAGWDDIEDGGREREAWLRRYLRLRNGIPGHDTIRRVFEVISPLALTHCFEAWMNETCPAVAGRIIAIDGQALRGSVRAEQITRGGGDYVLAVKENQPQLAVTLRGFFSSLNALGPCRRKVSLHETLDKGHGRIETRRCIATGELDWLELLGLKARWPKLASVVCIESTREIGERVATEKRYVIRSLPADSRRLLHVVRTHWGIENGLHGCLDVTFGEDARLIRLRHAAQNFAFLRHLALNLFRADQSRSFSLPRKLKTAAYHPEYLASALNMPVI